MPVTELSLIAFPTRELFVEKIEEFDLIIFDRYRQRGILPSSYLDNVVQYVRNGGTVLLAAGPEFGTADSLFRSPLAEILPVVPSGRVVDEGFLPQLTELGHRHPVTAGLDAFEPEDGTAAEGEGPHWGRWFRMVDVEATDGQVVMEGTGGRPLLVLNRVDEGRVAVLASDHAWLWGRGYEGGGPQLELLRRLAHWMLKEPELEEEALSVTAQGSTLTITRRTIGDPPGELTMTGPDGTETKLTLPEVRPGEYRLEWEAPDMGLYRLAQGDLSAVIAVGPSAPREFEQTIASDTILAPVTEATRGGILRLEDGAPDIRTVREGRQAAGRGWIGITPRNAYVTQDVSIAPLLPAWALLLLASLLAVGAWLYEGRRGPGAMARPVKDDLARDRGEFAPQQHRGADHRRRNQRDRTEQPGERGQGEIDRAQAAVEAARGGDVDLGRLGRAGKGTRIVHIVRDRSHQHGTIAEEPVRPDELEQRVREEQQHQEDAQLQPLAFRDGRDIGRDVGQQRRIGDDRGPAADGDHAGRGEEGRALAQAVDDLRVEDARLPGDHLLHPSRRYCCIRKVTEG